jgi:predicted adenine nucleotide alpha hydrolase (AANH) superfamily ATPase
MGENDFIAAGDIGVAKWKDRGKKCEYCNNARFREGASSPNEQREENLFRVLRV